MSHPIPFPVFTVCISNMKHLKCPKSGSIFIFFHITNRENNPKNGLKAERIIYPLKQEHFD
jgi:hypothetical protein